MTQVPHNLYIHVPFCMSKCNYCAFFSHACASPDWQQYTTQICTEINFWAQKMGKITVPTVFFGGGTPSLMPVDTFQAILTKIRQCFNLDHDAEITLESNPKTLDKEKLKNFQAAGANRLSVGVQSFNDEKLKFLGRRHNAHDAQTLIEMAQDIGMRVSGDFIYGLPEEDVHDVIQTCKQINQIGLTHCSMYELTIEPNTPFGKMNLNMPDNETMAQMYIAISDNLKLPRYEISNYAHDPDICKHNTNIWMGDAYIGIGNGAAGRVYIDNAWYEQNGGNIKMQLISENTRAIEQVITGMRTVRGCQLTDAIKNVIDIDWAVQNEHLVKITDGRIAATNAGLLILDDLMVKLVK